MSIESMKMALEALEAEQPGIRTSFTVALKYREKVKQAITALRQAIEQAEKQEPEQEPVALNKNMTLGCPAYLHDLAKPEQDYRDAIIPVIQQAEAAIYKAEVTK